MTTDEAKDYIREWCPYGKQDEIIKALSNSDEDCISRKATLNAIIKRLCLKDESYLIFDEQIIYNTVKDMPSIQLKPKTGYWTRELIRNENGGCIGAKMICSECDSDNGHDEYMNYCPNCGAKMESEDKE